VAYTLAHQDDDYADAGFDVRWLRNNPEVAEVADRYISSRNSDQPWSIERLQQELEETSWWSNRTEAQRRFEQLEQTQPAQANLEIGDAARQAMEFAMLLGIRITDAQAKDLGRKAALNQWDETDFRYAIAELSNGQIESGGTYFGDAQSAMAQFRAWEQQYLVRASESTMNDWAIQVVRGQRTIEDFQDWYRTRAQRLYHGVADDIAAGMTTQEILDPYMRIAQDELGVSPANVDLFDPKWTAALTGKNGTALTAEEWLAKIRIDSRYGWDKTVKAQNEAAELGNNVLALFGMRGR